MKSIAVILIAVAACSTSEEPAGPAPVAAEPPPGAGFHRVGRSIVDDQGRTVTLHGASVANSSKSSPDRMPWQKEADFRAFAATGLNSVRLLVEWAAVMPERGVIDSAYLEALATRVAWAADSGLLVVLDMHMDLFGYGFAGGNGAPVWACDEALYAAHVPQTPWWMSYTSKPMQACYDRLYSEEVDELEAAWTAVASRFAAEPAVVGFDLLNEPFWGSHELTTFVPDVWQPHLDELTAAVLAAAPGKLAFVEGVPLTALGLPDAFAPPKDARTVFAPHYYYPPVHEGQPYETSAWPSIEQNLDAMQTSAENLGGVPVWVGEFGGPTAATGIGDYLGALVETFVARGWSWSYWSDDRDDGFGLRDTTGNFKPAVMAVLAAPYARRVPGPIEAQSLDFAAGRFELTFTWRVDAPLELWVGLDADLVVQSTSTGAQIACTAAPRPGVMLCEPPADAFGKTWRVTIAVPAL